MVIALVVGTLYGALIELVVIRRLFKAPRVIVLVATIGVAQLSLPILTAYPNLLGSGPAVPRSRRLDLEHRQQPAAQGPRAARS